MFRVLPDENLARHVNVVRLNVISLPLGRRRATGPPPVVGDPQAAARLSLLRGRRNRPPRGPSGAAAILVGAGLQQAFEIAPPKERLLTEMLDGQVNDTSAAYLKINPRRAVSPGLPFATNRTSR